MRNFTTAQLTENISETPEGYLVCSAVPIARLGAMLYSESETDKGDGALLIANPPSVLFADDTIASFEGKPVTIQHPLNYVSPENWKQLACGIAQNVRAGFGEDADKLLADLLITDATAIRLVKSGLREISCGYDAEYIVLDADNAQRTRITGNHIALVQFGRAGSEVAIRDSKPTIEDAEMQTETQPEKLGLLARLRKMLDAEVEIEVEAEKEPVTMDSICDMVKGICDRLDALESMKAADAVAEPDPAVTEAEAETETVIADKCQDSAIISKAEIICAGIENSATLMHDALRQGMKTADSKAAIESVLCGKEIDFESADHVELVFNAAATILTEQRSSVLAQTKTRDAAPAVHSSKAITPEELNEKNARHWAAQRGNTL